MSRKANEESKKTLKTSAKPVGASNGTGKKTTNQKKEIKSKNILNKSKKTSSASKKDNTKKTDLNAKSVKPNVKNSINSSTKKVSKKSAPKLDLMEYYDLPYRYNKTVVKILAQTPKRLFVYWDISDEDRENFEIQYGKDFFSNTKPVLVVHNTTKNYTFEFDINDFANSWYFDINDEKCDYVVELGRRAKVSNISLPNNYLFITSSNKIEAPNNHILFEKEQNIVFFRNVKTNQEVSKNIASLNLLKYIGKTFRISTLYNKIYRNEEVLDLKNPSSNNPTSKF